MMPGYKAINTYDEKKVIEQIFLHFCSRNSCELTSAESAALKRKVKADLGYNPNDIHFDAGSWEMCIVEAQSQFRENRKKKCNPPSQGVQMPILEVTKVTKRQIGEFIKTLVAAFPGKYTLQSAISQYAKEQGVEITSLSNITLAHIMRTATTGQNPVYDPGDGKLYPLPPEVKGQKKVIEPNPKQSKAKPAKFIEPSPKAKPRNNPSTMVFAPGDDQQFEVIIGEGPDSMTVKTRKLVTIIIIPAVLLIVMIIMF